MENPSSKSSIITLGDWLDSPAGNYLRAWEQERLDVLTADIFGFNALQVGLPQIDALRANRMQHRWLSDMCLPSDGQCINLARPLSLVHDYCDLPFPSHSLDLVVLPHVLEFAAEPHQILREVARVLIPEGQLIVCGFNPASLWGVRQSFGRLTGSHFLPQTATHERLAETTQYGIQPWAFRLLSTTVLEAEYVRPLFLHGKSGQPLVAVLRWGVHCAGGQTRAGHDTDWAGMDEKETSDYQHSGCREKYT